MSTISSGTLTTNSLVHTGDLTGELVIQTNGTTTAATFTTGQVLNLANPLPVASGGTGSATATFSGANITSLNASAISSGTIANARTTATDANGASTIVARDASGNFASNVVTHGAGSNTAPSITTTGDTNTGIFFPAADTIAFTEGGAESARLNADAQFVSAAGTASLPVLTTTGDLNTGVFYPAADTVAWSTGGSERMRIDSSGNVGIGSTSPTTYVDGSRVLVVETSSGRSGLTFVGNQSSADEILGRINFTDSGSTNTSYRNAIIDGVRGSNDNSAYLTFSTSNSGNPAERVRINSTGTLLIGKTTEDFSVAGVQLFGGTTNKGLTEITTSGVQPLTIRRNTNDGGLILFFQDSTQEGDISVSGTTVSYNGGHLSRYAQLTVPKDETNLLKGTVMSNLDEMNVYTDAEGNSVDNEQLNKVKVSDVEGDVNVAGVFVNWSYDEAHQVDEINMAMTGDMIIRIAQGVVVQKGDLLMSAGDGTAKPQGDDIVRSKTVAKVTSNHVTCTYADGSYCVPCVLMAC